MQRAWLCGITVLGPWVQIHGNDTNKVGSDVSIGHHATTTTMRDTHIHLFRRGLQYTLVDAQLPIVCPSWLDHSILQHMTVQHASSAKKLWPTLVGCIAQCTTTKGTLYTAKPTELTSISTTKEIPGQSYHLQKVYDALGRAWQSLHANWLELTMRPLCTCMA